MALLRNQNKKCSETFIMNAYLCIFFIMAVLILSEIL